jgi:hypothetical protein
VLIEGTKRIGGVWKFRTTSWNTVNAILSSLALIKTITGGPLAGIPLHLVLSPKTVTVPTSGQNMVVYVVSLEFRGPEEVLAEMGYEIARRRIEHQVKMEQIEAEARRLLLPPQAEPPEEQEETAQEFYPEGAAALALAEAPPCEVCHCRHLPTEPCPVQPSPVAFTTCGVCGKEHFASDSCPVCAKRPQEPGNDNRVITLPDLMELAKKPDAEVDLPIPLITTKGVKIGRWLDWGPNAAGKMQITLEMADNLKELAEGLTVEYVKKAFDNAGLNLVVTTAPTGAGVQVNELPSQDGVLRVEVKPEAPKPEPGSKGKKHLQPLTNPAQDGKALF